MEKKEVINMTLKEEYELLEKEYNALPDEEKRILQERWDDASEAEEN